jgi:hypothetical protein
MEKKILLVFLIVGTVFLSACNLRPMSCSDDNVCSLDEEVIGTCRDCLPDFVVTDKDMYVTYDPNKNIIDATTCIKNTGGNFEGEIQVGWQVSSQKDYRSDYTTETLYFNGPSAESHAYLTVKNHQILFNRDVRIGKQDQYYCISKQFDNIQPAPEYWVSIQVSSPNAEEKDVANNWATTRVVGIRENYPDYLIEENLGNNGEFQYINSAYDDYTEDGYAFGVHSATYGNNFDGSGYNIAYTAENAVFDSSQSASEYLQLVLTQVSYGTIFDGEVFILGDNNIPVFLWESGPSLIVVSKGSTSTDDYTLENDPVMNAYLAKFPVIVAEVATTR